MLAVAFYGKILHGKNKQVIVRQAIKIWNPHRVYKVKREVESFCWFVWQSKWRRSIYWFFTILLSTIDYCSFAKGTTSPSSFFLGLDGENTRIQGSNAFSDYLWHMRAPWGDLFLGGREWTLSHFILFLYLHVLVRGAVKTNREKSIRPPVRLYNLSQLILHL